MIYLSHPWGTTPAYPTALTAVCRALADQNQACVAPYVMTQEWLTPDSEAAVRYSLHCLQRLATSILVLPLLDWFTTPHIQREVFIARALSLPIHSPADFNLPPPTIADLPAWYGGPAFIKGVNQ